jgi:serine/threonine protein kinase
MAVRSFRMDEVFDFQSFTGGNYIMPYCLKVQVNKQGATATVYHVYIQECLLINEPLRKRVERTKINLADYGVCYQFALKSYSSEMKLYFDWETDAFEGLHEQDAKGMVEYLGEYEYEEDGKMTYNILLEWGGYDLDQYFESNKFCPPVRTKEIEKFYQNMFEVADAIKLIHTLIKTEEGGVKQIYHGYHSDIKPDNILRMSDGKFKLADFGFAKFSLRGDGTKKLDKNFDFGTLAYGECRAYLTYIWLLT